MSPRAKTALGLILADTLLLASLSTEALRLSDSAFPWLFFIGALALIVAADYSKKIWATPPALPIVSDPAESPASRSRPDTALLTLYALHLLGYALLWVATIIQFLTDTHFAISAPLAALIVTPSIFYFPVSLLRRKA